MTIFTQPKNCEMNIDEKYLQLMSWTDCKEDIIALNEVKAEKSLTKKLWIKVKPLAIN